MKKLLSAVMVAGLAAGSASADSLSFAFGTNFYKPSDVAAVTQNGQNFGVSWNLDNDVTLGVYAENSNLMVGGVTGALSVAAISLSKGLMKSVKAGLNLGSATETGINGAGARTFPLADVFGSVDIVSGGGDKISGALTATLAARFAQDNATPDNWDGYNANLAVSVTF